MSYCPNCGNQLDDGEKFCSVCGMQQEQPKRPETNAEIEPPKKKNGSKPVVRIIVGVIIVLAIIGIIVGVVIKNKKPSNKKIMESFKEYYIEYSDKYYTKDLDSSIDSMTASHWDCVGKVIYFEGEPMMVIADMIGSMSDVSDAVYNVGLYAYQDGEVVERYKIKDLLTNNYGFSCYVNRDYVLFYTQPYSFDCVGSVYILKDNDIEAYNIFEDEDTKEYYCCDYNDKGKTPVEVEDYILNSYKLVSLPYNYFINKDNVVNSLTQEDFTNYLDELAEQKEINNDNQLIKLYCDYSGYDCGTTIADAMNSKSNTDVKFMFNGENYTFSADNGINELANLPTCVQEFQSDGQKGINSFSFNGYKKTKGNVITSEYIDDGNKCAILGYAFPNTDRFATPAVGTASIINSDRITNAYVGGYRIGYDTYGILKFDLVDNYEFDNLTKDSSIEEIENVGFSTSCYEDVYYKIYSDMPLNTEDLETDYSNMYHSGLSRDEIMAGGVNKYIDYMHEYASLVSGIPTFDCIIDGNSGSHIVISSEIEQKYNEYYENFTRNIVNKDRRQAEYKDAAEYGLGLATQFHLLETGQIDYFIVAEMDAYYDGWKSDYENELREYYDEAAASDEYVKNMSVDEYVDSMISEMAGSASVAGNGFTHSAPLYKDNILSIYIITNMDTYNSWLRNANWKVDDSTENADETSVERYDEEIIDEE